jgi:hypothetical protein
MQGKMAHTGENQDRSYWKTNINHTLVTKYNHTVVNDRMTDDEVKYLESGRGLIKVLFQHLPERTEENHENPPYKSKALPLHQQVTLSNDIHHKITVLQAPLV